MMLRIMNGHVLRMIVLVLGPIPNARYSCITFQVLVAVADAIIAIWRLCGFSGGKPGRWIA